MAGSLLMGGLGGLLSGIKKKKGDSSDDAKKMPKKPQLPTVPGFGGSSASDIASYKRGGKIKGKKGKAVIIKAHAGERVLTPKQQKRMKKRMKRGGKKR